MKNLQEKKEFFEKMNCAEKIAKKDLRSCYQDQGIFASPINFSDYWARDSFWAILGMLEIGDFSQVKKSLELFLKYQHKNGKIPRKIKTDFNLFKYLFKIKIKRKAFQPVYFSSVAPFLSLDDNLLFVIVFCVYVEKTKDKKFAEKYFFQVQSALEFFQKRKIVRAGLLYETGFSNWMDTVFKRGLVLYTNGLWFGAIKKFEELSLSMDYPKSELIPNSKLVKEVILEKFWLEIEGFFADSISKKGKPDKIFDLAGNSVVLFFRIADQEQTKKIFEKISLTLERKKFISLNLINTPQYSWWRINPFVRLLGLGRYQNGISWSWVEALLVVVRVKYGFLKEAEANLEKFSSIITKNGHIHETYNLDGTPFGNFIWKSAVPFAWGSGLFLLAVEEFKKAQNSFR